MHDSTKVLPRLDAKIARDISLSATQKLMECNKASDIIGTYIVTILEQHSNVLLFPFSRTDIWGFVGKYENKVFSCINTSIPLEEQVFVAAHELYHIWFNGHEELILSKDIEGTEISGTQLNEQKANRFAAEFLVQATLLKAEITMFSIKPEKIGIKTVLQLANSFTVPYRSMVKRLFEIEIITRKQAIELLGQPEQFIDHWRQRLGYGLPHPTKKKKLGNLLDLAMQAFESDLITRDKLDYLLEMVGIEPNQLGLSADVKQYLFPPDGVKGNQEESE